MLVSLIKKSKPKSGKVKIAIDQTGRYSEPLAYFLQNKGYQLYYVGSKAVKGIRKYLLNEEDKNDVLDAIKFAYVLCLKDNNNLEFGINKVVLQMDSQAIVMRTLILQQFQLTKLIVQIRNKIRQLVYVVFPEGEKSYFVDLLKILEDYPTPPDILKASNAKTCI